MELDLFNFHITCHIMRTAKYCIRFLPGFFVLLIASVIAVPNMISFFPYLIKNSPHYYLFILNAFLTIFSFIMWLWSWGVTVLGDPGRTYDDLESRGVLKRILQGDIPDCLRRLPICPICHLPTPPLSHHCKMCDACHLRYDHHCGITGQCIADKNFKSFILNFFYGTIYGFSLFPAALATCYQYKFPRQLGSFVILIYSSMFGGIMFFTGISFFVSAAQNISIAQKVKGKFSLESCSILFSTFGSTWKERLLPMQKKTTEFAWPGVIWDTDENIQFL